METIPPEILFEIFSQSWKEDKCTLRCVCKSFAELLTPRLFETVSFWLENESLERFLQFSRTPVSAHVKHLYCGFEHFSPDVARSETGYLTELWGRVYWGDWGDMPQPPTFENISNELSKFSEDWRTKYTQNRLKDGYATYRRYLEAQTASQRSGAHIRILTEALKALPMLQSLTIIDDCNQAPGISAVRDLTLMPPMAARWTEERDVFATVIRAISRLSSPLREFAIVGGEVCDEVPVHTFDIPQCEEPMIVKAFSSLRRLHLNPQGLGWDPSVVDTGGLAKLCGSAPNLEDLVLDFGEGKLAYSVNIAKLIGTNHFPRLRRVKLREIEFELRDLMAFLIRHAATLRVLHLKTIHLARKKPEGVKPGLWVNAFEYIRTRLQLEQARFDGFLADRHFTLNLSANPRLNPPSIGRYVEFKEGKLLAEDYVTKKGNVNPLVKMEEERRSTNPAASEDGDQSDGVDEL